MMANIKIGISSKHLKSFVILKKLIITSECPRGLWKIIYCAFPLLIPPIVNKYLERNVDPKLQIPILSILAIFAICHCIIAINIKTILYHFSDAFYYDEFKSDLMQFELASEIFLKKLHISEE